MHEPVSLPVKKKSREVFQRYRGLTSKWTENEHKRLVGGRSALRRVQKTLLYTFCPFADTVAQCMFTALKPTEYHIFQPHSGSSGVDLETLLNSATVSFARQTPNTAVVSGNY